MELVEKKSHRTLFESIMTKIITHRKKKCEQQIQNWYFVTKIFLTSCGKIFSWYREKLLKFEAEGKDFAKFLRSLEQFIQTVKGQNNLGNRMFLTCS